MKKLEIAFKSFIFGVLLSACLWLIYLLREVIILLFLVLIFTSSLLPSVNYLSKKGISRFWSAILVYLVLFSVLALSFSLIIPIVVKESFDLLQKLPLLLSQSSFIKDINFIPFSSISALPFNALKFIMNIFSNFLAILFILVLTFYCLMGRDQLPRILSKFFNDYQFEKKLIKILEAVENQLGNWVRGQLLLMIIIGVLSYLGFKIIGLHFAAPLALLAGLFEFIPNIGPVLAAIPAFLVGLSVSPNVGLTSIIVALIVQQLENHLIVPQIMKHATGLPPVVTIICILVGLNLGGAAGAILAIPLFLTLKTVIKYGLEFKKL